MYTLFILLEILVSILLIIVILMQSSKMLTRISRRMKRVYIKPLKLMYFECF